MPDDFEPDVASGDPGDAGSSPDDSSVDDATPAGDPAEPADDAPADGPTDDDTAPQEPGTTPVTGGSERFQKLLAKYGGDGDKMADAFWNQANSMSEFSKKLDAINERLSQQHTTPEDEAKYLAEDPDVKEIGTDLASLEADLRGYEAQDREYVKQYGVLEALLQELNAELKFAPDDITKMDVQRRISDAKREQRDVSRDWRANLDSHKQASRAKLVTERLKREAESRAKVKRDQARQQEGSVKATSQATRTEFASAIQAEAQSYGIALDSRTYGVIRQSINDRLVQYLLALPKGSEGVDIPGAVSVLFKEYADTMNLKKRFATVSKQKAGATTQPAGRQPAANEKDPPKDKTGNYWDPKWVRERAKRLLPG